MKKINPFSPGFPDRGLEAMLGAQQASRVHRLHMPPEIVHITALEVRARAQESMARLAPYCDEIRTVHACMARRVYELMLDYMDRPQIEAWENEGGAIR